MSSPRRSGPPGMARSVLELDLSCLRDPDVGTVATLALLRLVASSGGMELRLRRSSSELRELVCFMGLTEALGLEAERQAEAWEKPPGVEEERELGDGGA